MNINKEIFYYKVYGLNIESDIKIDEFVINKSKKNDIKFILDNMPEEIIKLKREGKRVHYSKNKVWFHINNIASYYITNGDTVIVEPCENADMQLLNVYLMCSCLGFIMIQREQVAIHGGVVNIDNTAIVFTGDRGAGKSTLTTALRNKGYKFLADDVAATYLDKIPYVYPGFPYQKLCEDVMEHMEFEKEKYTFFTADNKTKFMIPADDSFYNKLVKLHAICKLTVENVENVTMEELKGSEKLNLIIKNVYREEFFPYMGGMSPSYFKKCLEIAKNIKCYKITRPKEGFTVNEQIQLIEDTFKNISYRTSK